MRNLKLKRAILKITQFVVSLLPLLLFLVINREKFFTGEVTKNGWSCLVYVTFVITFIALKDSMGDLLKHNALLKISLVLGAMFYFFKGIAEDMMWMCICTAIGGLLAMIPQHFVNELSKDVEAKRNGKAMAEALAEREISGRV